jgi:hypothetical protein
MALFQKPEGRNKKIEELSNLIQKKRMNIRQDSGETGKTAKKEKSGAKAAPASAPAAKAPPPRPAAARGGSTPIAKSKSFNKEAIKFTAFPSSLSGEKNTVKEIDDKIRSIIDKDVGRFSGHMSIMIEQNKIVDIEMNKVETDEDITDKLITKDNFEDLMHYYENPDSVRFEIANLAKGLDKDQLEKAINMGAEAIIKKVRLKADGTIEYNFIASVKK